MRDVLNPYGQLALVELAFDCATRARELKEPGPFTPEQRRNLVQDTYWLLRAVSSVIEWGPLQPGGKRRPGRPLDSRDESFESCFLPWYEKEKAVLRVIIAERALRVGYPERREPGFRAASLHQQVAGREDDLRMFLQTLDVRFGRLRLRKPMIGAP